MKILTFPGMGDLYWLFVKLQDYCKQHGVDQCEIYTWEGQSQKLGRSTDFINRVPFVTYGGRHEAPFKGQAFNDVYFKPIWKKEPFAPYDQLLSMNGVLRCGYDLESNGLEDYKSDWYFPLKPSSVEEKYKQIYKEKYGDYIVAYFTDDGMFKHWLKSYPVKEIYELLFMIHTLCKRKIVLSGCSWDRTFAEELLALDKSNIITPLFDTTVDQLFALIQSSKGMVGWCGGNTIMSTYFKKSTLMIWSKYFEKTQFYYNCVPPDSVNKWYVPVIVERDSPAVITNNAIRLFSK